MIPEMFAPMTRLFARARPTPEQLLRQPGGQDERTGAQAAKQGIAGVDMGGLDLDLDDRITIYKRMRRNPTIALARLIVTAPIRSVEWSVDGEDDERREWVEEVISPMLPGLVADATRALDFGAQHWEVVWELAENRWRPRKAKALEVSKTDVRVDKSTGAYAGLKQDDIEIAPPAALTFTNDPDPGDFYGASRSENVRATWERWEKLQGRLDVYAINAAAAIPIVEYPVGKGRDQDGTQQDNYDLAVSVLQLLGTAKGVCMPNSLAPYAEDLLRQGMDPSKLRAWHLDFLKAGDSGGSQLIAIARHWESLMMRGWLVPERAGLEGEHGTKAEAETHTEPVADGADLFLADLARHLNWYVIDPALALNWGLDARGSVELRPGPVNDQVREMLQGIVEKVLTNPVSLDLFADTIDWQASVDRVGVPRREDMNDDLTAARGRQASARARAGPGGQAIEDIDVGA